MYRWYDIFCHLKTTCFSRYLPNAQNINDLILILLLRSNFSENHLKLSSILYRVRLTQIVTNKLPMHLVWFTAPCRMCPKIISSRTFGEHRSDRTSIQRDWFFFSHFEQGLSFCFDPANPLPRSKVERPSREIWISKVKWNHPSLRCESDWGQWRKHSYLLHRQTNLSLSRPSLSTDRCAATLWDFL